MIPVSYITFVSIPWLVMNDTQYQIYRKRMTLGILFPSMISI